MEAKWRSLLKLNLAVHILTTKFKQQNCAQNLTLTSASNTKSLLNVSDSNMNWEKTTATTPTGVSTSYLVTDIYSRNKGCQLGQIIRGVFKFHATTWLSWE